MLYLHLCFTHFDISPNAEHTVNLSCGSTGVAVFLKVWHLISQKVFCEQKSGGEKFEIYRITSVLCASYKTNGGGTGE